ncbi:hypothetical protein DSL72_008539 [Monilinia vaccinii-corymbosi]|uniref:NACHT domain-containing protein n=1 Tax=Monilinia vaccinii-corymbosi TaxID=61207 RepID=A0A8A3PR10_9HELO|nr:hypothetical protein DSL72_008539 [Monilinia vaccinii-corymbosi]
MHEERAELYCEDDPKLLPVDTLLQKYIDKLPSTSSCHLVANVEDLMKEIELLENYYPSNDGSQSFGRKISPLVDFLTICGPAVDMIFQCYPAPSDLIWSATKALLEIGRTSIRHYQLVSRIVLKVTNIVDISVHYEVLFGSEPRVSKALADLYFEILVFLRSVRAALSRDTFKLERTVLKSLDAEFTNHVQRLSKATKTLSHEATFAFEQYNEFYAVKESQATENRALEISSSPENKDADIRPRVMAWLSPGEYYESLHQACAKRSANTGQWLLVDTSFQNWINGVLDPVLWCYGSPGCGKTILSATVIQHLQDYYGSTPTVYFHCSSRDQLKQSKESIYISLLGQITSQAIDIPQALISAHFLAERYGRCRISVTDRIAELFAEVLRVLPSLNIIIDGIDECESEDMLGILRLLNGISRDRNTIRLLLFSRDILPVRKELGTLPSIHINKNVVQSDIDQYLREAIETLPCTESHIKQYVYNILSQKAAGMFLFARLGVETLQATFSTQDMLASLDRLPTGLYNVYGQILERLASKPLAGRSLARRIFHWVCRTSRPLNWLELQCALSWDEERMVFDGNGAPSKDSVLEVCCPLVEYRTESDTFHLGHLSVYEYLHDRSNFHLLSSQASGFLLEEKFSHLGLAQATLTYLSKSGIAESINLNCQQYPLAKYATENWCYHLSLSVYDVKLHRQYEKFVASETRRSAWITRSLLSEDLAFPMHRIAKLQRLVQTWINQSDTPGKQSAEDLMDIQKALFRLDDFIQSQRRGGLGNINVISNFERSMIIRDLARLYTMSGQIDMGVRVFEEEITKTGGTNSGKASKAWLLNSLGILYDQQGRFRLAEAIQRQALAVQLRFLPHNHLDITLTINELGRVCRHLHKHPEAESLHRRALHALQRILPPTDYHIIWTQNALARCYRSPSRSPCLPRDALALHTLAYTSMVTTLGPLHPHTIWTLSDTARCLAQLGRADDALAVRRRVVAQRVAVLGKAHADTLWAMNSLGCCLEGRGELGEARTWHVEAWLGQVSLLGSEHAHARWSLQALVRTGVWCPLVGGWVDGFLGISMVGGIWDILR